MSALLARLLGTGLYGIGAAAFAEKLLPVFPSYLLYTWLGMTATRSAADLLPMVLVASMGSTLASLCWYIFGTALGPRRTERWVVRLGEPAGLDAPRYRALSQRCRQRPFPWVLLGQVTPVVRLCVPVVAGVLRVRALTFVSATILGNGFWNALFLGLGFALSHHARDPASVGLGVLVALLLSEASLAVVWRHRQRASGSGQPRRLKNSLSKP